MIGRWFRDLSLRWKLFGGFGAVLALTVIMGVVSLSSASNMNSLSQTVGTSDVPSILAIDDILASVNNYETAVSQGLFYTGPQAAAEINVAKADAASINAKLKSYAGLVGSPADGRDWQRVKQLWPVIESDAAPLLNPAATLNAHYEAIVAKLGKTDIPPLRSLIAQWRAYNVGFIHNGVQQDSSAYSSARLLGLVLMGIALLVGFAIAFLVARNIKQTVDVVLERLQSLESKCVTYVQEGLRAMADGDLTHRYRPETTEIENPSADELGQVAKAVNSVREKIAEAIASYNEMADSLGGVVRQIATAAGAVSSSSGQLTSSSDESGRAASESGRAANEIATAIGEIASGAQSQVTAVEQVRTSAKEVGRAINEIAQGASQQVEAIEHVRSAAVDVGRAIGEIAEGANRQVAAVQEVRASATEVATAVETAAASARRPPRPRTTLARSPKRA